MCDIRNEQARRLHGGRRSEGSGLLEYLRRSLLRRRERRRPPLFGLLCEGLLGGLPQSPFGLLFLGLLAFGTLLRNEYNLKRTR